MYCNGIVPCELIKGNGFIRDLGYFELFGNNRAMDLVKSIVISIFVGRNIALLGIGIFLKVEIHEEI